jgi:hypothetical protein
MDSSGGAANPENRDVGSNPGPEATYTEHASTTRGKRGLEGHLDDLIALGIGFYLEGSDEESRHLAGR